MGTEQGTLFPVDNPAPVDGRSDAEIAASIAANAPTDPYASQEQRAQQIVEHRGEDLAREQTGVPSLPLEVDDTAVKAARSLVDADPDEVLDAGEAAYKEFLTPKPPTPGEVAKTKDLIAATKAAKSAKRVPEDK